LSRDDCAECRHRSSKCRSIPGAEVIQWCRCGGAAEVNRCRSQIWRSGVLRLIWSCCGYQNEVFLQVVICVDAG